MYPDYYYTKDHEWIKVEGGQGLVGITDFAQKQLGDLVYVELPSVGTKLAVHQKIGTIESVKAVSDVFCPVAGEVVAVNADLEGGPELVNQDPHGKGWILRLKLANRADLGGLMKASEYEKYLAGLEH